MMWINVAVFTLWMISGGCTDQANISDPIQYTALDFLAKVHSGKMIFIYFEHQVSPTISLFLVELEKSAEVLRDYGILVGKIDCNKEQVPSYCAKDQRVLHVAYLFRNGKEFLSFDLDTVFDVNSIVSEVLFAILRDEVKYVHSDNDLLAMEKTARGKRDIVLGYVSSLGTQEHRSIMETAYVYGSKYQFILITGGPVLKYLGMNESLPSSGVWVLHCSSHARVATPTNTERCPLTQMRRPLSTLSLHAFLQLMEVPLVSEVYEDPSAVPAPQFPYQLTPQLFLFSHPGTEDVDRDTATALAWRLRGLALTVLVHRKSPAVKTPNEYNVAYRLPERGPEVKYLTLRNFNEVSELFLYQEKDEEDEEEEEGAEDDEDEDQSDGTLEDEIAASVYENRGDMLHNMLDSLIQLTSENFHAAVAQSSLTVVLYYVKWDAVSMAVLSSFIEVAERLADSEVDDVQMGAVDCGEWTDLCAAQLSNGLPILFQPITAFPTILLLRPHGAVREYRGMLGSRALHRFIMLSRPSSPVPLSTQDEVSSFLQEAMDPKSAGYKPDRVLGLFKTQTHAGLRLFTEAAEALRGQLLMGLLTDGLAEKWAADLNADLPFILAFPSWKTLSHPSKMSLSSSAEELISDINAALLHPLPELTVENLPGFLSRGKALLVLFVGEEEDEFGQRQTRVLLEEMRGLVDLGGRKMKPYLPCWIHLGHTPAGVLVLESYLGSLPPLPTLVLTHLPSRKEVYRFPPSSPMLAPSVLQWLQRVEEGSEFPAGTLGEDSWPPAVKFYDFLSVMDEEEPGWAQQKSAREENKDAEESDVREDDLPSEKAPGSSRGSPTPAPTSSLHSEL